MKPTIEQISKAILEGKDLFLGVKLPCRQTHGKTFQIRSYAKLCATRIFNKNFKDSNIETAL